MKGKGKEIFSTLGPSTLNKDFLKFSNKKKKYLKKIIDCLNRTGINFWLDGGALLRLVRGENPLNSRDFDFGVISNDKNKLLKSLEKLSNKIEVIPQGGYMIFDDLIKIRVPLNNGNNYLLVDVFIYNKNKNELFRKCIHKPVESNKFSVWLCYLINFLLKEKKVIEKDYKNFSIKKFFLFLFNYRLRIIFVKLFLLPLYKSFGKTKWIVIPIKFFKKNLKTTSFLGKNIKIPNRVKEYLKYKFGKNWKIPDKNWKIKQSPILKIRKIDHFKYTQISINEKI